MCIPYIDRILNEVHKLIRMGYIHDETIKKEKYPLRRAAAVGCTFAAAAGSRLALHGQRCQNVLCNAACAGLRLSLIHI